MSYVSYELCIYDTWIVGMLTGVVVVLFFFKQKTAYEMRISDWSSDVCSSDLVAPSRQGKKAMTGYFSPEMSFAMHMTARKHGMSLQDAMAEAFNDWLRKMGESPVGK